MPISVSICIAMYVSRAIESKSHPTSLQNCLKPGSMHIKWAVTARYCSKCNDDMWRWSKYCDYTTLTFKHRFHKFDFRARSHLLQFKDRTSTPLPFEIVGGQDILLCSVSMSIWRDSSQQRQRVPATARCIYTSPLLKASWRNGSYCPRMNNARKP